MIYAESIFSLSNILAFLLGILAGVVLLLAIFAIIIASDKKKDKKIAGPTVEKFKEDEIKQLILNKQTDFIKLVEEDDEEYLTTCLKLTKELLHEISSYYYPNSKYPEYELTITEAGELIHYIVEQVLNLMDRPVLRKLKNVKLSTIARTIDDSKKVTDTKAAKAAKKSSGIAKSAATVINALNPVMWFRKIVVNGTLNVAIKKLCKAELSISGREMNKVYSKSLFEKYDEIEKDTIEKEKQDIEEIFADSED